MRYTFLVMLVVLLLGAILSFITGCSGGNAIRKTTADVVFIYDTDIATATVYKTLFEANNLTTDLISINSLSHTDLSACKLIMVDDDTVSTWTDTLRSANLSKQIKDSNKPVLAAGEGTMLFDAAAFQLEIGFNNSTYSVGTTTLVSDPTYFTGISGASTAGASVKLLTANANSINLSSANLTGASHPISASGVGRYAICRQDKYVHWGFIARTNIQTDTYHVLLVNVIKKLITPI